MSRRSLWAPVLAACMAWNCASLGSDTAVVGCQMADTVTTIIALKQGATELNPLIAGVLKAGGLPALVLIKIAATWMIVKYARPETQTLAAKPPKPALDDAERPLDEAESPREVPDQEPVQAVSRPVESGRAIGSVLTCIVAAHNLGI